MGLPQIYAWLLRREKVKLELAYRGSQYGYTLPKFHEHVDGKAPLIFFVKSAVHNRVFGGYTSRPWSTPFCQDSQFHGDHNAFIFSLSRKSKHIPFQNEHNAVQHFKKDGLFAFGWGDFGILENCDKRDDNYSNFGVTKWTRYTYRLPRLLKENSDEAYRYLAGAHEFRVEKVEIYEVMYIK